MFGLRMEEDARFKKFWNKVQQEAQKQDATFFADICCGKDTDIGDMTADIVIGWLIPNNLVGKFDKEFQADKVDEEEWEKFIVTEVFEALPYGNVKIWFEKFPIEPTMP